LLPSPRGLWEKSQKDGQVRVAMQIEEGEEKKKRAGGKQLKKRSQVFYGENKGSTIITGKKKSHETRGKRDRARRVIKPCVKKKEKKKPPCSFRRGTG